MFDFSFSELVVVAFIAVFILGKEEVVQILRALRRVTAWAKGQYEELVNSVEEESITDYIMDLDGNIPKAI